MTDPTLLAVEIAERTLAYLLKWQEAGQSVRPDAPEETKPENLIWMLERLMKIAEGNGREEIEWADTKLHRWLGFIFGSMVSNGMATLPKIKELVTRAKAEFLEKEDKDVVDHNNPDSPFELDIGGPG